MSVRTWLPQLVKLLLVVCRYVSRYRKQLLRSLENAGVTDGEAKLNAVIAACEALTIAIEFTEGD